MAHYPFIEVKEGIYAFTSEDGVVFGIKFKPLGFGLFNNTALDNSLVSIDLGVVQANENPSFDLGYATAGNKWDSRVSPTIAAIVKEWFAGPGSVDNIAVLVLFNGDAKAAKRVRYFSRIYHQFNDGQFFMKNLIYEIDPTVPDSGEHCCLFFRRENVHYDTLVAILDSHVPDSPITSK